MSIALRRRLTGAAFAISMICVLLAFGGLTAGAAIGGLGNLDGIYTKIDTEPINGTDSGNLFYDDFNIKVWDENASSGGEVVEIDITGNTPVVAILTMLKSGDEVTFVYGEIVEIKLTAAGEEYTIPPNLNFEGVVIYGNDSAEEINGAVINALEAGDKFYIDPTGIKTITLNNNSDYEFDFFLEANIYEIAVMRGASGSKITIGDTAGIEINIGNLIDDDSVTVIYASGATATFKLGNEVEDTGVTALNDEITGSGANSITLAGANDGDCSYTFTVSEKEAINAEVSGVFVTVEGNAGTKLLIAVGGDKGDEDEDGDKDGDEDNDGGSAKTFRAEVDYANELIIVRGEDLKDGDVMYALKVKDFAASLAKAKYFSLTGMIGEEDDEVIYAIDISKLIPKKQGKTYNIHIRGATGRITAAGDETAVKAATEIALAGRPAVKSDIPKGSVVFEGGNFRTTIASKHIQIRVNNSVGWIDMGKVPGKSEPVSSYSLEYGADSFPFGAVLFARTAPVEADGDGKGGEFASTEAKFSIKAQPKAPNTDPSKMFITKGKKDDDTYTIKGLNNKIEVFLGYKGVAKGDDVAAEEVWYSSQNKAVKVADLHAELNKAVFDDDGSIVLFADKNLEREITGIGHYGDKTTDPGNYEFTVRFKADGKKSASVKAIMKLKASDYALATAPVIETETTLKVGDAPEVTITGEGFDKNDLDISDFEFSYGTTGLTASGIKAGNTDKSVTFTFTGTMATGSLTITAKPSAFSPPATGKSNVLTVTIEAEASSGSDSQ